MSGLRAGRGRFDLSGTSGTLGFASGAEFWEPELRPMHRRGVDTIVGMPLGHPRNEAEGVDWHFFPKQSSEAEKNSTTDQHFRGKDRSPAAMLVREGFQNSLDARASEDEPVRIRIYTSLSEGALPDGAVSDFVTPTLVDHLFGKGAGISDWIRHLVAGRCPFLVFEDFGTHGLTGSVESDSSSSIGGGKNGFYYFMRAEGINDKSGSERGSWGVGKTVFPSSSRIHSILVASNRRGDRERPSVVMGRCILKYHETRSSPGTIWRPDGWFGVRQDRDDREGGFVVPTTVDASRSLLDRFRVSRGFEPGMSVVVPFVDSDDFSVQELLQAILQECCFAIANGDLVVSLESPQGSIEIDASTLAATVGKVTDPEVRKKLGQVVQLACDHARDIPNAKRIVLLDHEYSNSIKWSDGLWVDESLREKLRTRWEHDGQVWVRVPIRVRMKHGGGDTTESGTIDVLLKRDDDVGTTTPILVRDGLLIPGQGKSDRPTPLQGAHAVIRVGGDPVGDLVRDAEDPSHIKLDKRADKIKSKYLYGPAYLTFIRQAGAELLRLIRGEEDEDRELLADLIGLISNETKRRKEREAVIRPPVPQIDRKSPLLLSRIDSKTGFSYRHDPKGKRNVRSFRIRFAYDCDEGDPFRLYEPFDFDVGKNLAVEARGARWEKLAENAIEVEVEDPDFEIRVLGFDGRDVEVRTSRLEKVEEAQCQD